MGRSTKGISKKGHLKANISQLPFANQIGSIATSHYRRGASNNQMLEFGRRMRDEYISKFPVMGGAIQTYQTLCANREFRVSGSPRAASKALNFLQNSKTVTYEGIEDYGMYQFLQRLAMDSVAVGRFMWTWDEDGMEYLDPCYMRYDMQTNTWYDRWLNDKKYKHKKIVLNHTMPTGRSGNFVSPLLSVLPSAILEWLIREHDMASADGRKIRDIKIVIGEDIAEQLTDALEEHLSEYDGPTPESNDVHIVYADDSEFKQSAGDLVASLGLSNIPERLDRTKHKFGYVNELGNATGLTIRQFWNAEEATNRALEQVQQERQLSRGPGNFARATQRKINESGALLQFGRNTRMSFWEEVDASSKKVNAEVIQKYSDALLSFAKVFNGQVNGDALLAWLKADNILPVDLDLITEIGEMIATDTVDTPQDGERIVESDITASPGLVSENGSDEKHLDYDEVTLDQNGSVIDYRRKVVHFQKILQKSIQDDRVIEHDYRVEKPDFKEALENVRRKNLKMFRQHFKSIKTSQKEMIPEKDEDVKPQHHRLISDIIMQNSELFEEAV